MTVQAQFLTKKWEISPNKIMALDDLNYKSAVKTETAKTSGGKDKIVSKGYEADTLSISYKVLRSAGCDPDKEFSDAKMLTGLIGPFILGGSRFGATKWRLISVKPSDIEQLANGEILSMRLTLNFEEPNAAKETNVEKIGKLASNIVKAATEKGIK